MKKCPYCDEEIQDKAIKCKHCGSMLTTKPSAGESNLVFPDPLDGMRTIQSFRKGSTIDGRYEVLFKLGEGGMGKVYLTKDIDLDGELRAVKILPIQVANDLRAISRLKDEAKLSMSLNHENIVKLYHYDHDGDVHYLVMEYVNGIDLQTYLGVKGKISEKEVRRIGIGVAKGLKHAHDMKVVHRDIKPSNILLESQKLNMEEIKGKYPNLLDKDIPDLTGANVRLTDFGIARQVRESMSRYSRGDTSGTLMYMSPEQVRGKGVDHRSDLYSLGVTLYELLTGDPPFTGGLLPYQILSEEPEPITFIDSKFNAIILKLLDKNNEKRFSNAEELIRVLEGKDIGAEDAEQKRLEVEVQAKRDAAKEKAKQEEAARQKQEDEEKARLFHEKERKRRQEAGEEITNSLGMTFVLIPAGTFMMGTPSDEPGRRIYETQCHVTLTKEFYMQTTEVTQRQWLAIMGNNPSYFSNCGKDCPVEQVSWDDVQEFIWQLNQKEGRSYRLPTEAEWEYAARAGTATPFNTGNCLSTDQANYNGNYPIAGCSKGEYRETTVRAGSFSPNAWGLYDMHGNVEEWVQDWKGKYPTGHVTDPVGPLSGSCRVSRGGSGSCSAWNCRSADRGGSIPSFRHNNLGFRISIGGLKMSNQIYSIANTRRHAIMPHTLEKGFKFVGASYYSLDPEDMYIKKYGKFL